MEKDIAIKKHCKLLIIGGSAGSLEVILHTLPHIHTTINFAILIIMHRGTEPDPLLQFILSSKTSLIVKEAEEKEEIQPGIIYIAPADYHLLIEKDHTFSLDFSEKVNFSRPSIDVTFSVAAEAYGEELACLLLSGGNTDGTDGLLLIKAAGGITAIQDPATANVPFMPQYALSKMQPDYILSPGEVAAFINNLS